MTYPLTTLLTILQQAEYDLPVYWGWVSQKRPAAEVERLSQITPERWTPKLKTIRAISSWLALIIGAAAAVSWSVRLLEIPQHLTTRLILHRAAARLTQLQSRGLTVIAIAGSYAKTSTKHQLFHLLSTRHFTHMTPESVNTPLGIASTIMKLSSRHSIFIVELGEQKPGDLTRLLALTKPDIAVITPIGFAHQEHFGSTHSLQSSFAELNRSAHRPALMIIDDTNRGIFAPESEAIWYGQDQESTFSISETTTSITGTSAKITTPTQIEVIESPLLGEHQLRNSLPGLAILSLDQRPTTIKALTYASAVTRRLEIHHNPNGTTVIDNSYNTNPGSWREMRSLIKSLSLPKVVFITAGFVEMDENTSKDEHEKLATDLKALGIGVVVLRTRYNAELRQSLTNYSKGQSDFNYAEANSLSEALETITAQKWPLETLWLEGGCRELYQ